MRTVSLAEFSLAEFPAGHRERLLLAALPGLIGSVSLPALVAREAVRDALAAGQPSVHINAESGGLIISTHCLRPGDDASLSSVCAWRSTGTLVNRARMGTHQAPEATEIACAAFRGAGSRSCIVLIRPPSGKKVLWQEMLRHELLAALEDRPVVIVPVGSVEQHGPHCPQDVDISIPYHLAINTAEAIDDFPVIVAPPVMYGFTHYNMGEVGTITLGLEVFIAVLCDVCRSIWANGFTRIIMLNGHGGNQAPTWDASVKLAEEDVWALALTYWNMANDELTAWSEADAGSIGHGGEWETSLQLFLRPELVDMTLAVKDEWRRHFSEAVQRYAIFPERRREMAHGVMGDPFVASAEKGERLFNVLVERLVTLTREYHDAEPPRYREFGSHCP